MRKVYKYFIPATLAIIALVGCDNVDNEQEVTSRKNFPNFTATIGSEQTRAAGQSWDKGDEIGISGCNRSNVCYLTNDGNGSFTAKNVGEQIYFQNDSEVDFTAYYPWNNLEEGATVINADTRNQAQQKSFDFLWAKASGKKDNPNVTFKFTHRMARLSLTVKSGIGMSFDEVKTARLSLEGFQHTGSFNTADGSTTTAGGVSGAWTFSEFAQLNEVEKTMTFSFFFFPQVLANPLKFLAELEQSDNNKLSLKADIDFTAANRGKDGDAAKNEWVAGRQYDLSLILDKTGLTLNGTTITDWDKLNVGDINTGNNQQNR